MSRALRLLGWLLLLGPACGERAAAPQPQAASPAAAAEGEMCEHGVLAAVCTKCNPALIPVFQAKGDWCAEHGFPLSFCPVHHPERGGRPAADVSSDGAPADGTKIKFKSPESARLAGLEVAPAQERPGEAGLEVTARIAADAAKVARVNARAPGVLREVKVDVGAPVARGAALAVIESAAVSSEQSALQVARVRAQTAEADLARLQRLLEQGIVAQRAVRDAQAELDSAKAEERAARAALGVVGAGSGGSGRYTLTAPLAGVVTRREAAVGAMVGEGDELFEIVDTSTVWAELDVPEAMVSGLAAGQAVRVTADTLPDRVFEGTIAFLAPRVDPQTRTVLARVRLDNADGALRENMYGSARIAAPGTEAVAVPPAALQRAGQVALVFVQLAPDTYEARRVTVGATGAEAVVLTRGVKPGEPVVTTGSFLLKTETLKDSIGSGCCDVE